MLFQDAGRPYCIRLGRDLLSPSLKGNLMGVRRLKHVLSRVHVIPAGRTVLQSNCLSPWHCTVILSSENKGLYLTPLSLWHLQSQNGAKINMHAKKQGDHTFLFPPNRQQVSIPCTFGEWKFWSVAHLVLHFSFHHCKEIVVTRFVI